MKLLREVDAETLAQWIEDGGVDLIDIRDPGEFAAEHLDDARLVPLDDLDPAALEGSKGRICVFYDRNGADAQANAEWLVLAGYDEVYHLEGGFNAWRRAGLPTRRNPMYGRPAKQAGGAERSTVSGALRAMAHRYLPPLGWLPAYNRGDLTGDLMAGVITAIMLVPQAMAYALLAGLPPQVGLYASILPPILYGVFGSSRALAVGPVAIMSIMVAAALGQLGIASVEEQLMAALILAFMMGSILIIMGLLRIGFLVNFLSHPVLSGFTSAAAVVIILSQVKHLAGLSIARGGVGETLAAIFDNLGNVNYTTLAIGIGAVLALMFMKGPMGRWLVGIGLPKSLVDPLGKAGPLVVVALGALIVWSGGLDEASSVKIVGSIPIGLPDFKAPAFDPELVRELLPTAVLISLIGFMESVSVAKALASRRRQKIDPNQELVALGAANIGSAFSGGYPVAGGFGRSMVNFSAGAVTPLAGIITAVLMAVSVILFTPLFFYLPQAVLAAIIVLAVSQLFDLKTLRHTLRYNRADSVSLLLTFVCVLLFNVEIGLLVGVASSLLLYLWRTSRPHMAVVGRVPGTEHYRNIMRHRVETDPAILAIRVDESLYFANAGYLEDRILAAVADQPEIDHFILICSAVNMIDAGALETLEHLADNLRAAGVTMHLAEVKGPVMDKLRRSDFAEYLGEGRIFLSTHAAVTALSKHRAAAD